MNTSVDKWAHIHSSVCIEPLYLGFWTFKFLNDRSLASFLDFINVKRTCVCLCSVVHETSLTNLLLYNYSLVKYRLG